MSVTSTNLLAHAYQLESAATGGYVLNTTGPRTYDCSGLVWRVLTDLGLYTGPRFSTRDLNTLVKYARVTSPLPGDLVYWPNRHVAFYIGNGQMYGANGVNLGMGTTGIQNFLPGLAPQYLRVVGVAYPAPAPIRPPFPGYLRIGMRGAIVAAWQTRLNLHGYRLAVDGIAGPLTINALKNAQQVAHVAVDGIGGPITWGVL